jgi:hypothetical protein
MAGGQVLMGPHEVPGGSWIVQALDPQGAVRAELVPRVLEGAQCALVLAPVHGEGARTRTPRTLHAPPHHAASMQSARPIFLTSRERSGDGIAV